MPKEYVNFDHDIEKMKKEILEVSDYADIDFSYLDELKDLDLVPVTRLNGAKEYIGNSWFGAWVQTNSGRITGFAFNSEDSGTKYCGNTRYFVAGDTYRIDVFSYTCGAGIQCVKFVKR